MECCKACSTGQIKELDYFKHRESMVGLVCVFFVLFLLWLFRGEK